MTTEWPIWLDKSRSEYPAQNRRPRFRSTFRRPHFSARCGLICSRSRSARRSPTHKLRRPSAVLRRFVQLRGHARPTLWLLRFRAIAFFARTAISADIERQWRALGVAPGRLVRMASGVDATHFHPRRKRTRACLRFLSQGRGRRAGSHNGRRATRSSSHPKNTTQCQQRNHRDRSKEPHHLA